MTNVAHNPATRNTAEDTGQIPVLFDAESDTARVARPGGPDYMAIQRSQEFASLRGRFRRFVFPMSVLFVVWYLAYVILAAYFHDFMSTKVFGEVNVGILLGVGQFVSTALIIVAYLSFARRRLDPQVEQIRQQAGA
jgi:uncharacterized membrane protein (DUF485 family)